MTDAGYQRDATRVTDWGTERALFLGDAGDRMFAVIHRPAEPPRGTVIVCSSLFTDTIFNYRREVEVARILAEAGLVVGRFQYRGTGQSEGDPLDLTYASMMEDALRLIDHMTKAEGGMAPGVLGTRWGALVAAGVVRTFDNAPLAIWEPVVDGGAFLREALQASGVAHMTAQLGGPSPKESLATLGVANILGFPMGRALFESGVNVSLVDVLGNVPRRILYLGPGKGAALARKDAQAVEALSGKGFDVSSRAIAGPKAWWFVDEVNPTPLDAAATTASWFEKSLEPVQ